MFYTVYKTTNLINGKIYVGLHVTRNLEDNYLGSGSQLKSAVKKYGKENFKREYIKICNSPEEMYKLEADIVNEDFVKRSDTYNMKTGGTGSWYHVNSNSEQKRKNSSKGGVKASSRGTNPFKDPEWQKQYNWTRTPEILKANSIKAKSPEAIAKKKKTFLERNHQQGEKNSQYGSKWCVEETAIDISNRKKFKEVPVGWITTTEWKERKKNKLKPAYGKHWYNDGIINYYLYPTDDKIKELNLEKRRLVSK